MNLIPQAYNPAALKCWRYNIRFALSALKKSRQHHGEWRTKASKKAIAASDKSARDMLERLLPKRHLGAGMAKHYK